jgi:ABC-type transporter Mla subunit MlaD
MEGLQRVLLRGEESRGQATQTMAALNEKIGLLTDMMRTSQQLMLRIGESQATLTPVLRQLGETMGGDEVARTHLRNIDLGLQRMTADMENGRAQMSTDLRNDLRLLTRTVAALAETQR